VSAVTNVAPPPEQAYQRRPLTSAPVLAECRQLLDLDPARPAALPFGADDVTASSESELQVAILGSGSTRGLGRLARRRRWG